MIFRGVYESTTGVTQLPVSSNKNAINIKAIRVTPFALFEHRGAGIDMPITCWVALYHRQTLENKWLVGNYSNHIDAYIIEAAGDSTCFASSSGWVDIGEKMQISECWLYINTNTNHSFMLEVDFDETTMSDNELALIAWR